MKSMDFSSPLNLSETPMLSRVSLLCVFLLLISVPLYVHATLLPILLLRNTFWRLAYLTSQYR